VLQACVDQLPDNLGRVFMMRELLEIETPEICKELGISATNCGVMMFRARMRLRECLEILAPAIGEGVAHLRGENPHQQQAQQQ
jgi:DNA-directed RNA polymerase specialized sigma24 family protein